MHLFASSGHNDENDVSDDVDVFEDDDNDGDGKNDDDDDEVPFCERLQWHLFR